MNIINIGDFYSTNITVDSTEVTVDSTSITVDSTSSSISGSYLITIIPREMVSPVKLILWDELKESESTQICNTTDNNGYMDVVFNYNFNEGDSFEATITDSDDKLLWRGKLYATSQTDNQEFKMNVPNNNNIIRI